MGYLPNILRPEGLQHREFRPGVDLPCWFSSELKGIDQHLYLVWHPWRIMYDDVMNQYTGSLEDPRHAIKEYHGQEIWGWPLYNDGENSPILENRWHIWRLCWPHGWCHVFNIDSPEQGHLNRLLETLFMQSKFRGKREYSEYMQRRAEENEAKATSEKNQLFNDVHNENKWLVRRAAENYERGIYEPTNPVKETITSYKGQGRRSKLSRPLDDRDKESGLVIPDSWKDS